MICPQCRSAFCFRSHRSGFVDWLFSGFGLRPWRCRACDMRFRARHVAISFVYYAHCPKCGNFDLERVGRDRVEEGTLLFLKRTLGFPAFRCDPCRHKFFSIRPFRRILPSMLPVEVRRVSGN